MNLYKALKNSDLNIKKIIYHNPTLPYAVYSDDINVRGADDVGNLIHTHKCEIEFYSESIDIENEAKIENVLNEATIEYEKLRTYIDENEIYFTQYLFSYVEKSNNDLERV